MAKSLIVTQMRVVGSEGNIGGKGDADLPLFFEQKSSLSRETRGC